MRRGWVAAGGVALVMAACGTAPPRGPAALGPSSADVVCSADGVAAPSSIDTRPDGVHFSVSSIEPGKGMFIVFYDEPDGAGNDSYGSAISPSEVTLVVAPAPPGIVRVGCFTTPYAQKDVTAGEVSEVEIVDGGGYWGPIALDCPTAPLEGTVRQGGNQDAETALSESLQGLKPSDLISAAGYRDYEKYSVYTVTREGSLIASLHVINVPNDPVGFSGRECQSAGLATGSVSDEVP